MDSMSKKTAEELLKIADDMKKQAAEVTQFVCDKCNHTTTLAKINGARKRTASEVGANVEVSEITVNDKVTCPACEGVLSYKATEESAPYYYDPEAKKAAEPSKKEVEEEKKETPEEQAKEEKGEKLHEEPHAASEKIDYDAIDRYLKG
jgi:hypothetical protein